MMDWEESGTRSAPEDWLSVSSERAWIGICT